MSKAVRNRASRYFLRGLIHTRLRLVWPCLSAIIFSAWSRSRAKRRPGKAATGPSRCRPRALAHLAGLARIIVGHFCHQRPISVFDRSRSSYRTHCKCSSTWYAREIISESTSLHFAQVCLHLRSRKCTSSRERHDCYADYKFQILIAYCFMVYRLIENFAIRWIVD